jgi:hypothetical protein
MFAHRCFLIAQAFTLSGLNKFRWIELNTNVLFFLIASLATGPSLKHSNSVPPLRIHGISQLLLKSKQPTAKGAPPASPKVIQTNPSGAIPSVVKPQLVIIPKVATQANVQMPRIDLKPALKPILNKPVSTKNGNVAPGAGKKIRPLFISCVVNTIYCQKAIGRFRHG